MPKPEYEDHEIWERLYLAEARQLAEGAVEHSWSEGEDGEQEFDRRVLLVAKDKDVLDIGCGPGEFTLEIAKVARRVAGIDFSERALLMALDNRGLSDRSNVEFRLARADKLPYPENCFDLATCRRGPAVDSDESIHEVHRVLRSGGHLVAQEIGERDKQNWAEIFESRSQMHPGKVNVAVGVKNRLARAGFRSVQVDEFEAMEYFATVQDFIMRLENSPIIHDFDKARDEPRVREIAKWFTTPKGIASNTHRGLITATK